jgi:acyl-CoA synthetase (AMP-forming)/AMP-acid ligase II
MSALKRDAAKVIAFTYVGGEDEQRLEMTYRAAHCRQRARDLTSVASAILDDLDDVAVEARKELEKIIALLGMLGRLGGVPNPSA